MEYPEKEPNSNPNPCLPATVAGTWWMPAANDLLSVGHNGRIRTLAVFPPRLVPRPARILPSQIPMQPVPTAVVRGPTTPSTSAS